MPELLPGPLQRLIDDSEITRLVYRVARSMDARDWTLLRNCFTDQPLGDFANGDVGGISAVLQQYQDFLTPLDVTQHLVSNVEVELEGDVATSHATFIAQHLRSTAGTGQYLLGGVYDDDVIRTDRGWRIEKRRVRGLWSAGDATVLTTALTRS